MTGKEKHTTRKCEAQTEQSCGSESRIRMLREQPRSGKINAAPAGRRRGVLVHLAPALLLSALISALFLFAGCKNIITQTDVTRASDRQGPTIDITSPSNGSYYAATVTVTGKVTDTAANHAQGEVDSVSYQVVGKASSGNVTFANDGSFTFSVATSGFSGDISIQVTATDWNKNTGTATLTLKDQRTIVPATPTGLTIDTSDTSKLAITWDAVSGSPTYYLWRSESQNGTYSEVYAGLNTFYDDPYDAANPGPANANSLTDKTTYYYKVAAHNQAGTSDPSPVVSAFFDKDRPTITITAINSAAYSSPGYTNDTTPTIGGTAASQSGLQKIEVSLDGGATWSTATGTTTWSFTPVSALADGTYNLVVKATDDNAKTNQTSNQKLVVDTVKPTITINSPTNNAKLKSSSVTVSGSASDNNVLKSIEVAVDSGSYITIAGATSWSYQVTSLSDGAHTIHAQATDAAGNVSASTSISVSVDTTAPTISITSPTNGYTTNSSASITVHGTSSDPNGGTVASVKIKVDNGSWINATGTTSSWTASTGTLSSWDHAITAEAIDAYGNTGTASPITVTVVGAPTGIAASGMDSSYHTAIRVSWSAAPVSGVTYSVKRGSTVITTGLTTPYYSDSGSTARTSYAYSVATTVNSVTSAYSTTATGYRSGVYVFDRDFGSGSLTGLDGGGPYGIAIYSGVLYATGENGDVVTFNPATGALQTTIDSTYSSPRGVDVSSITGSTNLWVSDAAANTVSKWVVNGGYSWIKDYTGYSAPTDLASASLGSDGYLWVAEPSANTVQCDSLLDGSVLGNLSAALAPHGLDVYNGYLWVASGSGKVYKYSYQSSCGTLQANPIDTGDTNILDVTHDADGYMIVTTHGGFYVYSPDGTTPIQTYSNLGAGGNGLMTSPTSAVTYNGELYVSAHNSDRIEVFKIQ